MSRNVISTLVALVYSATIPPLLALHVHVIAIGSGNHVLSVPETSSKLLESSASQGAMCQLCSRLTSTSLPEFGSGLILTGQFCQSFRLSEPPAVFFVLFHSVYLRAPPIAAVA
jgi:hypothetical protein